MKSWLRSRRFFMQTLALTMGLLLVICIFFVTVLYTSSRRNTMEAIFQTETERTTELLRQTDIYLEQIIVTGYSYVILKAPYEEMLENFYARSTLDSMVSSHMGVNSYISNIDIEVRKTSLYPSTVLHERSLGAFYIYEILCPLETEWPYSFDLVTKDRMYPNRVTLTVDGFFLSRQVFSDQSAGREEYLLLPDGTVLLSNQKAVFFRHIQDCLPGIDLETSTTAQQDLGVYGNQYYVLSEPDKYGFRVLSLVPQALYDSRHETVILQTVLMSCCLFAVAVVASLFLVQRFYRPIKKTVEMLQTYIPDDLHKYESEIAYIHQNIARYAIKKPESESLTQIQKAQTAVLQHQINSHFLFNTLENIKALSISELGMENEIENSIMLLNTIIREGVFQKNIFVPLSHELHLSKCYSELMLLRFPDVEITWDVDESLSQCQVFKFSLQPVLENCFSHAFRENRNSSKRIAVRVKRNELGFSVFVEDNGTGIKAEVIPHLEQMLRAPDETENAGHVGIHNIHKRITDTFGPDYGIHFASTAGGTVVELRYPISSPWELSN